MSFRLQKYFLFLTVFVVVALFYVPTATYGILDLDDPEYILENDHLKNGLTAQSALWALFSCGYASNWHPLAWMSMMADVSVARNLDDPLRVYAPVQRHDIQAGYGKLEEEANQLEPLDEFVITKNEIWTVHDGIVARVMHVHNLILHAANSALLFLVLVTIASCWRYNGDGLESGNIVINGEKNRGILVICVLLTLFWAVHPLRCEVVCWLSERKELTCVFFMLISFLAYLAYLRNHHLILLILSVLCHALSLMAKPLAVVLPVILLAWEWTLMGRRSWKQVVPFVTMSLGTCILTMIAQQESIRNLEEASVGVRTSMALKAPLIYLWQTLFPMNLSAFYPLEFSIDWIGFVAGSLFLACLVAGCCYWWRRQGRLSGIFAFAVAWCYIGLLPMLGIVKVGHQPHSDRYTYWVSCGLAVVVLLVIKYLREVFFTRRIGNSIGQTSDISMEIKVLLALVLIYLPIGLTRMSVWHDTGHFYTDAALHLVTDGYRKIRGDAKAVWELTGHLVHFGRRQTAEKLLRESASELANSDAYGALALYLAEKPNGDDAEEISGLALRALRLNPYNAVAYEALGRMCENEGNSEAALENYEKAVNLGRISKKMTLSLGLLRKSVLDSKRSRK